MSDAAEPETVDESPPVGVSDTSAPTSPSADVIVDAAADEVPAPDGELPSDDVAPDPSDAAPADPSDAAPADPSDAAPADPSDAAPADPSDAVPADPSDAAPAESAEPAAPAEGETLGDPTTESPAGPAESPAAEIPAVDTPADAPDSPVYHDIAADPVLVDSSPEVLDAPPGSVTVDFVILPEHYGQSKVLDVKEKVKDIRMMLEKELSIPDGSLFLMNMTGAVEAQGILDIEKCLYEFDLRDGDKIGVELRINYYQEQETEQYVMPDVLELTIHDGVETKVVPVYIERPTQRKPYLGGYRNKQTNLEYHHALSQTPVTVKDESVFKYHRETQTVNAVSRSSQCPRDVGTQMDKPGLFMTTSEDKTVEARDIYFSSADLFALRLEMAIIIQCHVRGMFARQRARRLQQERHARLKLQADQIDKEKLLKELQHKREIERRIHPRTYQDFQILRAELEAWRQNETNRIQGSNFDKELKHAALKQLLQKETKLLQTIDKLRNQACHLNRDHKVQSRLEAMAQPKVWAQADLETTTVHTPFTTRAKELMDLYNGLRIPLLTVDERLDVLLHVKWTTKEFDCNLTREIVDLVDREADMLNRGRPAAAFKGLRRRLANLFLQFVDTPEFNPEARRFQKVARDLYQQTSVQPLSTVPLGAPEY